MRQPAAIGGFEVANCDLKDLLTAGKRCGTGRCLRPVRRAHYLKTDSV